MKRLAALTGAAILASCTPSPHHLPEAFPYYYKHPAAGSTTEVVESKEIRHWGTNPREKQRAGYLERNETQVAGSRDTREGYYIWNDVHTTRIGFITAEGGFYRFDANGRLGESLGAYPIVMGLKLFFGLPLSENLELAEIDPYR